MIEAMRCITIVEKQLFFKKVSQTSKTLILVLATFVPMTNNSIEEIMLEKVFYIYYFVWFQENNEQIKILLNNNSKINTMSPGYIKKLGLKIWKINIVAQKIDDSTFNSFGIVIAKFEMEDKIGRLRFFQKTFLMSDIKFKRIKKIFFLKNQPCGFII